MKLASILVGGAALSAAGAVLAQSAPPVGQQAQPPAAAAQPQRQYNLSAAERTALAPLLAAHGAATTAVAQGRPADWAAVEALLPAALAAAQGDDAKYLVARVQLAMALATSNNDLKAVALDALIASPGSTPDELGRYLNARAEMAFAAEDFATAERLFERLLQLSPGDQRLTNNLVIVRRRMGNSAGALEAVLQVLQAQETANQRADESTYRRARDIAHSARDRRALDFATRLARHYPTPANWRDALHVYREIARPPTILALDLLRLTRTVGGLSGQSDYLAFAQILDQGGLPGETKAVIDEGVALGVLRAGDPVVAQLLTTANRRIGEDRSGLAAQIAQARSAAAGRPARVAADALYGYGRFGEAAELYRRATTKSGEDAGILNLRLGAALAMAGQRADAEAALRAATGDAAGLAQLWLAWLSRRTD
jgi:Flp pilus assembly protein TadD